MEKRRLQEILSQPFQIVEWISILKNVFCARNILQKPLPINLTSNKKAESAFELGSFNTSDNRIIGLYLVKVKPEVWLEKNKVGLRELLRSVYKYEVDGALIVFEQQDKWRLSFVSEIRTFDDHGNIAKKITEPKRYTYLLGRGEKTKTAVQRLSGLSGKTISLEDIRNSFSVEALNEEFYKIVARHFYQLVGATEGKGSKAITYDRVLNLPGVNPESKEGNKIYQEFAVRLIGRTVFCWFLKVKKSNNGVSLLPEHLLSSDAVSKSKNYYHLILEQLFFQILNTPIDERIKGLPKGSDQIPFLNGGLFEPQPEDYYKPNKSTGISDNQNKLKIPDNWFVDFFENLEQYNFTIDENSVVDIEVSVDPEMLGRIFENLLAEIDPDSGDTARKATGSYYTPREIVDYMATESLVHYLNNQTNINKMDLRPIFNIDSEVSFTKNKTEKILEALDSLKILDPACGSGAFPMGVLQKIVMALEKLDEKAEWWINKQVSKNTDPTARASVRNKLKSNPEYARKIGIIQHNLYGVDVQPIAAEISKLRCFLTLIVDENIDERKSNRGVEPLPNLEFKFVTADTLLQLPPEHDNKGLASLFGNQAELEELQGIRLDYLQSYGEHKRILKERFLQLQKQIFKQQLSFGAKDESRAYKISSWNPFSHDKVDWFDPLWMYGVKKFDIVIGNPPYVSAIDLKKNLSETNYKALKSSYETAKGTVDLFVYFFERGFKLLKENGQLVFITPNRYLSASYGEELRKYFCNNSTLTEIIDYSHVRVFKKASIYPVVSFITNKKSAGIDYDISVGKYDEVKSIINYKSVKSDKLNFLEGYIWGYLLNDKLTLTEKVVNTSVSITECALINATSTAAEADEFHELINEKEGLKLINTGTIDRYITLWGKEKLTDKGQHYLEPYLEVDPKKINANRIRLYESEKIVLAKIAVRTEAFYDPKGEYASVNTNCFHSFKEGFRPKYVLAWLNSKLFQYTFECFFEGLKMQGGYLLYSSPNISKMYIKKAMEDVQAVIEIVVDYLLELLQLDDKYSIYEDVPNGHLIQLFDEVIDALMYEVYFEKDFKREKIGFIEYAKRDFKEINGLEKEEKIKSIKNTYQLLSKKENEIRQNLKLMDTRLGELIMPIKSMK